MPTHTAEYLSDLYSRKLIPLPLRRNSKHLDIEAMGFQPLHFVTRRKRLKELAFDSVCYCLSQKPPSLDSIIEWFHDFKGNIGILGGYENLVVLDFDKIDFYEKWRAQHSEKLKETLTVRSPKGFHVYLRSKTPTITSSMYWNHRKVGHIKSLGGYVVAPNSSLNESALYYWHCENTLQSNPTQINQLQDLDIYGESPIKSIYDKFMGRGYFTIE